MELLPTVARFNANRDYANLNCNRNPQNSKSGNDENAALGITQPASRTFPMKTHHHLYEKLCSWENLEKAYHKARRGKTKKPSVIEFEKNAKAELRKLQEELKSKTYQPRHLKRFIVRDPKTRVIHASEFHDRIVHHALVNILEPIYEKIFIDDSYANRKEKGTHKAVLRFEYFKRKVSANGRLIAHARTSNHVEGYVLKADIKHYFDTVDHEILLDILRKKIKDMDVLWLTRRILENFETKVAGKGMPLGNLTSQFFANVYLNELDYFVKHQLKMKYYIRYVDDMVMLHPEKEVLLRVQEKVQAFLKSLKLELHPDKTKIVPLRDGLTFLGYREFYQHRLLRKRNKRRFERRFIQKLEHCKQGLLSEKNLRNSVSGWMGYARWADTHKYRKNIQGKISEAFGKPW